MQRSPPNKFQKKPNTPMDQTQSEPNIIQAVNDPEFSNVHVRHKRPRCDSTSDQLDDFKQEIKDILASWQSEQEQTISKFMAEQKALVTKLVSDMADMKHQNLEIQKTNIGIEKSIASISDLYDDMKCQVKRLQDECGEYRKLAESLEKTVRDIQFKSRSSSIEIRNVPNQDKESSADLVKIMTAIGKTVDLPIAPSSIRDIHRIPGSSATKPIVVEFTSVNFKSDLISHVRGYNNKQKAKENKLNTELLGISGQKRAVYIDDHLTNSTKRLFYLAREYAKKHEFKFCWASNGNIFLRKQPGLQQILVKSEATLMELEEKK
ncbi:hypothetical protein PYW07_002083 [Mythimna separata]|uniref:FP protein C-terminal domain-containing protein n=1 Tax=Mythimna separata TaxID=271217 RepID=A0AAD7YML5_MYTSE|nr:hypothetical protein PYW07_002083 [Mythimna separata]